MTETEYNAIENCMLSHMQDSAHDKNHVYRVLNAAIDISNHENAVDSDVLIAACLLHDIGREKQFADLENICHAKVGGDMAYDFLTARGWEEQKAQHVKECIVAHRFRGGNAPQSLEAKILFDADKLDACGAIGVARSLIYSGQVDQPLYVIDENNNIITDGGGAEVSSFFQEYNYKLKKVYDSFHTTRAKEIANIRQEAAVDFYNALFCEISENYKHGQVTNEFS